jgi:hypothetical protein
VIRRNIHKGFNLSGDDARVLWPEREESSAKDSISEFVQSLELLVDCIARRDLN